MPSDATVRTRSPHVGLFSTCQGHPGSDHFHPVFLPSWPLELSNAHGASHCKQLTAETLWWPPALHLPVSMLFSLSFTLWPHVPRTDSISAHSSPSPPAHRNAAGTHMFLDRLVSGAFVPAVVWIVHDARAHAGGTTHLPVFAERDFGSVPQGLGHLRVRRAGA